MTGQTALLNNLNKAFLQEAPLQAPEKSTSCEQVYLIASTKPVVRLATECLNSLTHYFESKFCLDFFSIGSAENVKIISDVKDAVKVFYNSLSSLVCMPNGKNNSTFIQKMLDVLLIGLNTSAKKINFISLQSLLNLLNSPKDSSLQKWIFDTSLRFAKIGFAQEEISHVARMYLIEANKNGSLERQMLQESALTLFSKLIKKGSHLYQILQIAEEGLLTGGVFERENSFNLLMLLIKEKKAIPSVVAILQKIIDSNNASSKPYLMDLFIALSEEGSELEKVAEIATHYFLNNDHQNLKIPFELILKNEMMFSYTEVYQLLLGFVNRGVAHKKVSEIACEHLNSKIVSIQRKSLNLLYKILVLNPHFIIDCEDIYQRLKPLADKNIATRFILDITKNLLFGTNVQAWKPSFNFLGSLIEQKVAVDHVAQIVIKAFFSGSPAHRNFAHQLLLKMILNKVAVNKVAKAARKGLVHENLSVVSFSSDILFLLIEKGLATNHVALAIFDGFLSFDPKIVECSEMLGKKLVTQNWMWNLPIAALTLYSDWRFGAVSED